MFHKMQKILKNKKGFTLIELITVIVILGVILGIGLPKYAKMQAQSEYDSDVSTLRNLEKAAEVYYASNIGAGSSVTLKNISDAGLFDSSVVLKRKINGTDAKKPSVRNSTKAKVPTNTAIVMDTAGNVKWVDTAPADGINDWINKVIGARP